MLTRPRPSISYPCRSTAIYNQQIHIRASDFSLGYSSSLVKPTTLMWLNLRDDIFKGGRKLTVGRLNLIERADRELTAGDDQTMKRARRSDSFVSPTSFRGESVLFVARRNGLRRAASLGTGTTCAGTTGSTVLSEMCAGNWTLA